MNWSVIAILGVLGIAGVIIVAAACNSCAKDDTEQTLVDLKAVAFRTKTTAANNPWIIGDNDVAPTHGKLGMFPNMQWVQNNILYKKIDIKSNVNSGYADICAISIVIDYDENCSTLEPFDYASLHSDLQSALVKYPGGFMTNINNGKFYFCYYCIYPFTLDFTQGEYTLFQLTFKNIAPPCPVIFDMGQGNCEMSIDGWNNLSLSFQNIVL